MPPRKPVFTRKRCATTTSTANKKRHRRLLNCSSILHRQCAEIVEKILHSDATKSNGATIKSLTLASDVQFKKATHAVVCETLRYLAVIKEVLKRSGNDDHITCMTAGSAYVLIYEMLIGQGIENQGAAEDKIAAIKESLKIALADYMKEQGVKSVKDLVLHPKNTHCRFARVNTLKTSVQEAIRHYSQKWDVMVDELMEDVLQFPPGTDLHRDPLVRNGSVFLQGYGSCLASHALAPQKHWKVLDACAAPGNKTTHLAALTGNTGRIIALDIHQERFQRLKENIRLSGASHIECMHADFLSVDPCDEEFRSVDAILLDPSCSGSGTSFSRQDDLLPSSQGKDAKSSADCHRIQKLAAFQIKALRHALTFPAVRRIVYSTCSIHEEENERVVEAAMELASKKHFTLQKALPPWPRRGHPLFPECECMIRIDPVQDNTDGFFIAVFERHLAD